MAVFPQRIEAGQASPDLDRVVEIGRVGKMRRQGRESLIASIAQPNPFGGAPGVHYLVPDAQAGEEIPGKKPRRLLHGVRRAMRQQTFEVPDVDLDAFLNERDMMAIRVDQGRAVLADRLGQGEQALAQILPRSAVRALGPKQAGELVASKVSAGIRGQIGEQQLRLARQRDLMAPITPQFDLTKQLEMERPRFHVRFHGMRHISS